MSAKTGEPARQPSIMESPDIRMTFSEIGLTLGISRYQAARLHDRAIKKIRESGILEAWLYAE